MSSDYTGKDTFLARWGDAEHIHDVIRGGIEPMIRTVMKNHNFTPEHHQQMKMHKHPYVRYLAVHSPHVTADDVSNWMKDPKSPPSLINNAMQHKLARVEDMKHVAFNNPTKIVVGGAINQVHARGGWTPEELSRLGNRTFPNAPSPHLAIPAHIWNSTMPKSHAPLTQADVNNAMVKERGGTLR